MIKRIKKANALMFTVVILLAVSIIASGITMYFYHASILANNSNIYSQKRVELENEFNKKFKVVLKDVEGSENENKARDFFKYHTSTPDSIAFLEGDYYTTIRYYGVVEGKDKFTYEVETEYKRRECHLIKTIYKIGTTYTVDPQEVYHVTINN